MGFKRADVEETALYAKKFVRYDEGARKYSMGLSKFQALAKEAKATYKVDKLVLVNCDLFEKYLETFRKEMKVLEDSIDMLMKRKGNHSKQLYPLLERRAKLALEKDKKLYLSKVKIDGILTDEQRATIDKFFNEQRKQHKGRPMPPKGDKFR